MDAKVTLNLNKTVTEKAKRFADDKNLSLSKLVEFILDQVTTKNYASLEDFPIADWVKQISEGEATYLTKPRSRKEMKKEYFESKK